MPLFCPSCQAPAAGAVACPRCGGRLVRPAESFAPGADRRAVLPPPLAPSAPARTAVGAVVAFGLYLALREWASAGAQAAGGAAAGWWATEPGELADYALRAVAAVVGGLLAGAGRRQGAGTGGAVGLLCGGLFLLADAQLGRPADGAPAAAAAVLVGLAAAAGVVGGWVWPAATTPPMADAGLGSRGSSLDRLADPDPDLAARPTAWGRVVLAAALAAAGVTYADAAREGVRRAGGGAFRVGGPAQAPAVSLQFALVFALAAGGLAGADAGAGLRHGLIAGGLAAAGVVGLAAADRTPLPVEGLWKLLGLPPDPTDGAGMAAILAAVGGACAAGGWLGGALLPPVVVGRRRLGTLS